jgi:hypothetical protein
MRQRDPMNLQEDQNSFCCHLSSLMARGRRPALASLLLLAGCSNFSMGNAVTGSGHTVAKPFDLAGFSKLSAGSAFQVNVTQGASYSVVVTIDDNLVEYLDVTKSGDTLRLSLKPDVGMRNATLQAQVTMPELTGLDLSGAAHTTLAGFSSEKPVTVGLSGASHLQGDLRSGDAQFHLSGASKVELRGSASNLKVSASGASRTQLDQFNVKEAVVDASGASHITLNVADKLEAEASGASHVRYLGQPQVLKSHTSGASSIGKQ